MLKTLFQTGSLCKPGQPKSSSSSKCFISHSCYVTRCFLCTRSTDSRGCCSARGSFGATAVCCYGQRGYRQQQPNDGQSSASTPVSALISSNQSGPIALSAAASDGSPCSLLPSHTSSYPHRLRSSSFSSFLLLTSLSAPPSSPPLQKFLQSMQ